MGDQSGMKNNTIIGLVLSSVPGYTETFFRNKIKGLQESGYTVILFVDYFRHEEDPFICKVVHTGNFNGFSIKFLIKVFVAIIKTVFIHPKKSIAYFSLDKADGLSYKRCIKNVLLNEPFFNHQLDWLHFGYGMLAYNRENIPNAIGAKMGVSFRGFDLYLSPIKHEHCYDRLFKKDIFYHVLSNKMKDLLVAHSISSEAISVIPPAIDVQLFERHETGLTDACIKILTVARLHWIKGLEYVLEAMSILKEQGVNFHYTIVGDGEDLERLVFAANQLNITDNVTFTGRLNQSEIKDLMLSSNIYVQYSIQEGFCNSVLEAQAMGLLCVVSDADGLIENVSDTHTGWVVPKRNPVALSTMIKTIINLPSGQQQQVKLQAVERVKKQFNLELQQKSFNAFYSQ